MLKNPTSCKVVVDYSSTHHKALKPTQSTILYDIDLLGLSTHCDTRKGVEIDKPNHPNMLFIQHNFLHSTFIYDKNLCQYLSALIHRELAPIRNIQEYYGH